jgi:hypothetical protein
VETADIPEHKELRRRLESESDSHEKSKQRANTFDFSSTSRRQVTTPQARKRTRAWIATSSSAYALPWLRAS